MYTVYITDSIELGALSSSVLEEHKFDSLESARTYMTTVMRLDPHFDARCIRCVKYSDTIVAVDFGSWSRFIFLIGENALNW